MPARPSKGQGENKATEQQNAKNHRPARAHLKRVTDEQFERRRIAVPDSGVGFAFGKSEVDEAKLRAWFSGLNIGQQCALRNRRGAITITGQTSSPGRQAGNEKLAFDRAQAVMRFLREELGCRCEITLKTRIAPEGRRDNAESRVATIKFETQYGIDSMKRFIRPQRGSIDALPMHIGGLPSAEGTKYEESRYDNNHLTPTIGPYYIMQHPNNATMRVIHKDKIPEGISKMNGFFLWAEGRDSAVRPQYPTTAEGARGQAKLNTGEKINDRTARTLIGVNKWLNSRLWCHLSSGKNMKDAVRAMERDAEVKLVRTMLLMTGLA